MNVSRNRILVHLLASISIPPRPHPYAYRNSTGVTLYHAQQQLAKLQLTQEEIQDKFSSIVQAKEDEGQKLEVTTGEYLLLLCG